jgi:hypothetical protein
MLCRCVSELRGQQRDICYVCRSNWAHHTHPSLECFVLFARVHLCVLHVALGMFPRTDSIAQMIATPPDADAAVLLTGRTLAGSGAITSPATICSEFAPAASVIQARTHCTREQRISGSPLDQSVGQDPVYLAALMTNMLGATQFCSCFVKPHTNVLLVPRAKLRH